MSATTDALGAFIERTLAAYPALFEPFDPDWRSDCEIGEPVGLGDERRIRWQPVRRPESDDFAGLANALECEIHPTLVDYYGSFWSAGLEASAEEGHASLILLWNPEDVDRLIENLIGHALVRARRRLPLTLFFACTEPQSDLLLSVRNGDGVIVAEDMHGKVVREVEADLPTFLNRLTPADPELHPER